MTGATMRVVLASGDAVEVEATAEAALRLRRDAADGRRHAKGLWPADDAAREAVALIRAICDEKDEIAAAIERALEARSP